MLRLCVQSCLYNSRSFIQPIVSTQNASNFKCASTVHNIITRNYAIKLTEPQKDNLEKVYYGPLTPQIKSVKVFSLSSSMAGLLAQPIIIREAANIGSTSILIALCSVVGFFTFITPILLHLVTKKYVTEIQYDPTTSTYRATTINFFLAKKLHEFKTEDVHVPDVPGMFTTMHAKGVPLFIEARHFNDPLHYAKIMGYDKPMDFKLGDTDSKDNTESK